MKSAVRISQLISQKNVQGINYEIQGVSTVAYRLDLVFGHSCSTSYRPIFDHSRAHS